jgi:DNA repair photolyase
LKIGEVYCRTVLSRSSLYDIDYSINPYVGCEHACRYCYSPFYVGHRFSGLSWGDYVYVKINAPRILSRELKHNPVGSVLISSITDPYQPLEGKFMVTRRLLELLVKSSLEIYILTKSPLVVRDLDVILRLKNAHVGFSFTNLDESLRVKFEPKAPSITDRLRALRDICASGVKSYAFIAPFMPINKDLAYNLMDELSSIGVDYVVVDKFNIHGNPHELINKLAPLLPEELIKQFEEILLHNYSYSMFYRSLKDDLARYARQINLNLYFSY